MARFLQPVLGLLMALGVLAGGLIPGSGNYFLASPFIFATPMAFRSMTLSLWFLGVFTLGLGSGRWFFGVYPGVWVLPECLALLFLIGIPWVLKGRHEKLRGLFLKEERTKREGWEGFQRTAENLRKENQLNEKKLRQVEHLYDVIKEAGGNLNVQEMIELGREFTERMFDLPHFILTVLSEDGKKYEVKVASGCDESAFRDFEIDLEGETLVALLGKEKRALYLPCLEENSPYSVFRSLGVGSFLLLPFLVQDRVIGFLCSFSRKENFLDQEKIANFQVFGNQISIGLQKSLLYEKVQKLSITDGLTKLHSHRHFRERLQEELVLAGRYSSQLSLLMLDIDHFKHYNDNYGHVAGDHVLMQVAKTLREKSDASHLAARYGGEEMVLVAPETTKEQGIELAERIRSAVESSDILVGKEVTQVKVSIGVATFPQDAQTGVELIAKADQALYAAKGRGRNRVVAYPP